MTPDKKSFVFLLLFILAVAVVVALFFKSGYFSSSYSGVLTPTEEYVAGESR